MLPFKGRDRRRVAADGAATSIVATESSRTVGDLGTGGVQAYRLASRPPTTVDPEAFSSLTRPWVPGISSQGCGVESPAGKTEQPEGAAREDRADLRCRRAPGAPAT